MAFAPRRDNPADNVGLQLMVGAGMLWGMKRMLFGKGKDKGTEAELEKLRLLQKIGEQNLEAQRLAMRKEVAIKGSEQGIYQSVGGKYVKK